LTINNLSIAFVDKHAGFNKALVATGLSLTGTDAGNYLITVGDTASIAQRALSVTATGQDKVYDGTRSATVTYADNRIAGDVFSINGTALFDSKNVGDNKPISVSLSLSGADAGNYLPNSTATTQADISKRDLTVTALAQDKVYDGSTTATISFGDNRVAGDVLTLASNAAFADKNVGIDKAVTGTLSVTGADASNYNFGTTLNLAADITPKLISADGTRVYDGLTAINADVLGLDAVISNDTVTLAGSGSMTDKHVGTNKSVNLTGLSLTGTDAGNYSLTGATVDITPRNLTVTGITAQDKVYDATTTATASGTPTITGTWIEGDAITVVPTASITVEFADKNAGQNKTLVVEGGLITGADAHNYQVVVQGTASISQRALGLSVDADDRVYDGTRTATITVADDRSGAMLTDALTIAATGLFADKHVGANKGVAVSLNVTGADSANYTWSDVTASTASITPRTLNVTATAEDRVYDRTTDATVSLADDRINGDVLSIAGVGTFADKNAGTGKTVTVALTSGGADVGNYSIADSVTTTAGISQRPITFTSLTVLDKTYDGTAAANMTGDFATVSGLITGDNVSVNTSHAVAAFADKHAGIDKTVTVSGVSLSGVDQANYSVQASAGTATIFKKTVDVTGLTPDSKVYDGTKAATVSGTPDVSASFIAGDDVALNVGNFTVEFADKHVGDNKALYVTGNLLSGSDAGNYEALLNTTGSITPRTLTATATGVDKVYDGTTAAMVSFSDNRIANDLLELGGTGTFADKNVGSNKAITLSGVNLGGDDAGNYSFSASGLVASASINPRIILASGSRVYDGTTTISDASLGFDNLIANDLVTLSGAVTLVDKHAGQNKAINGSLLLEGDDSQNYILSGIRYDVTPRALTVTGLTAESKVYDGLTSATAAGTPTIGLELVTGDTVSADLSSINVAFTDKNVGTGKTLIVTGNVLSGTDAGNYVPVLSATADITPKQLTLTGVDAENKVYDGTVTATKVVTGTPTLSGGVISGDDLTLDVANLAVAFADKNAGTDKSLVVTGASLSGNDAGNYQVSVDNATADISKRDLIVSITADDKVYDGSTAATVAKSDNRIANDVLTVSGTATFADKNAGTDKTVTLSGISLSGTDASNYNVNASATDTADITKKAITIAGLTADDKVYDASTSATVSTSNASGWISGDDFVVNATGAFADKHAADGKTVILSSTYGGNDIGNYTVTDQSTTTANISKRDLTVSVVAQNKVYDGTTTATFSTSDNRLVDDLLTVSGVGAFDSKDAGMNKTVSMTGVALSGADAGNYHVTNGTATGLATISKAPLTLTAEDKARVYGNTNPDFTALLSGFVAGETLENSGVTGQASGSTVATVASGVGQYVITPTLGTLSSGNYNFTDLETGVLTISPRPLYIVADNKLRFVGEDNPELTYSTGTGPGVGLVNGDSLASVNITAPNGTTAATGGEVFPLMPTGATFAAGSADNYAVRNTQGWLVVLPKPLTPEEDEQTIDDPSFFVELDESEILAMADELARQQATLIGEQTDRVQPLPTHVRTLSADELAQLLPRLNQVAQSDSHRLMALLRRQPVLLWHPDVPQTVLPLR
jgi:hypothetical protein